MFIVRIILIARQ